MWGGARGWSVGRPSEDSIFEPPQKQVLTFLSVLLTWLAIQAGPVQAVKEAAFR
jgi:hypothetical protein